ncbi:MAG TPA: ABC transporter ATP-binding protein, partial [Geobacteraceae bacterium]
TQSGDADDKIVVKGVSHIFPLHKGRGVEAREFVALEGIDLHVRQGEFLALVGPTGCGKSTLLDILAGLTRPTGGAAFIDGRKITGPALDRGIVLQGYALFPWRTVRENVEFGLEIKKLPKDERRATSSRFVALVGLEGFEDHYPHELSGGMKQRVALARALACDPDVLLMDEPFAAVDALTREGLQDELLRIWNETKKTIIFVTHSIEEAVFLADRVVVFTGTPGTVREVVKIDLPRPRSNSDLRSSAEFGWIRHKIWNLLQDRSEGERPFQTHVPSVADAIAPSAAL